MTHSNTPPIVPTPFRFEIGQTVRPKQWPEPHFTITEVHPGKVNYYIGRNIKTGNLRTFCEMEIEAIEEIQAELEASA